MLSALNQLRLAARGEAAASSPARAHTLLPKAAHAGGGVSSTTRLTNLGPAFAGSRLADIQAFLHAEHPHLYAQSQLHGRALFSRTGIAMGSIFLEEAAFASCSTVGSRGDEEKLLNSLTVHVGDGSPQASLPYFLQLEPNRSLMESSPSEPDRGATVLALFLPAIRRNGFLIGREGSLLASIFVASFINHSCQPNAAFTTSVNAEGVPQIQFTALRDISRDEEIRISYIGPGENADLHSRRLRLSHYGFHCTCPLCIKQSLEDPQPCACALCLAEAVDQR